MNLLKFQRKKNTFNNNNNNDNQFGDLKIHKMCKQVHSVCAYLNFLKLWTSHYKRAHTERKKRLQQQTRPKRNEMKRDVSCLLKISVARNQFLGLCHINRTKMNDFSLFSKRRENKFHSTIEQNWEKTTQQEHTHHFSMLIHCLKDSYVFVECTDEKNFCNSLLCQPKKKNKIRSKINEDYCVLHESLLLLSRCWSSQVNCIVSM